MLCCRVTKVLGTIAYTAEVTTGDVTTPASLVITPSSAVSSLENGDRLVLIVSNSVPVEGLTTPVTITINGTNAPVYNRYGNVIYGASLRVRSPLTAYYGTDGANSTAHLLITNSPILLFNR